MSDEERWAINEIERQREIIEILTDAIKTIYAMRGEDEEINKLCNEALDGGEE